VTQPSTLIAIFAALADPQRARMLRLLEREELAVGELALALQSPQSTMSRHLKALHDAGLVSKRAEGTATLYRLAPEAIAPEAREAWSMLRRTIDGREEFVDDDRRMAEVIAARSTDPKGFFGRVGGDWTGLRLGLFGDRFAGEALLDLLDPAWTVADLGCGTGEASELLAPVVRRVIAVDREKAMLEAARKRLKGARHVELRQGALESLPLKDGEADAAVIMLVLHHVPDPGAVLKEAVRGVRSGGGTLVVDLVPHDRRAYAASMGHLHMGFSRAELEQMARSAGVQLARHRELPPEPKTAGPGLFAALFRAPAARRAR